MAVQLTIGEYLFSQDFGGQRLWMSVGWGLSAVLVGRLVDLANRATILQDFSVAFNVMLDALMADFVTLGYGEVRNEFSINYDRVFFFFKW